MASFNVRKCIELLRLERSENLMARKLSAQVGTDVSFLKTNLQSEDDR